MTNQLDDLFINGKELDQGLVAKILAPFLRIDRDSCGIIPTERWLKLNNELKIILFLVARKVMKLRDLPIDNEGATPAEIETETGIKGGSIRPKLRGLFEDKTINRTEDARYFVPNYSLTKIKTMIETRLKEG